MEEEGTETTWDDDSYGVEGGTAMATKKEEEGLWVDGFGYVFENA